MKRRLLIFAIGCRFIPIDLRRRIIFRWVDRDMAQALINFGAEVVCNGHGKK